MGSSRRLRGKYKSPDLHEFVTSLSAGVELVGDKLPFEFISDLENSRRKTLGVVF